MSTLKPTKKISRRQELRQDTVVTFSARVWQAVEQNRSIVYGILGLLTLLVLGVIGYSYWQQHRNARGQELLAPAVSLYESGNYESALNGTDDTVGLLAIADDFGSTNAGNLARFYAADALYRVGEHDRALALFQDFRKDANYIGASALAGEAAIFEARGEHRQAGDLYKRAALLFPNEIASPGYLVDAGRAYEAAGRFDDAMDVYEMVSEEYPESNQARTVEILVARVEARRAAVS